MRKLLGEIWLTVDNLVDSGVDKRAVWTSINRNSSRWQAIKDPDDKRKRLIRYATLREGYKEAVRAELCGGLEPDEWMVMEREILQQARNDGKRAALVDKLEYVCEEGYRRFLHLYKGYNTKQQRRLSRGAAVVDTLAAWYRQNGIAWRSYEHVKQASQWLKSNKDEYPMYLTTVPTQLKEKVLAYAVEGKELNEVVTLPREGNNNRLSLGGEMWWQASAVKLAMSGRNMFLAERAFKRVPSDENKNALEDIKKAFEKLAAVKEPVKVIKAPAVKAPKAPAAKPAADKTPKEPDDSKKK